ncbi:phage protein, HK97 gp10 family [Tissierella praeacuta DSM 18095]|uniref:Phage protein, HK97 gp10 family n=1 Tax=Tissierella praeacuta DSM 18095 TaxID=1123404 RepID=A0A1M4Z6E0_9FIRM|nr:HK97-gp10 family putative phage morphogenesis protein [Tissierella praeacuta]TCU67501.1 HK97 gp10 family phage protein [Tissierella praeacuta]SHF13518.1 phage protein, HK97 gp10 family [Tissierella praeacuta DSM 18095]SUP00597.1 phage protein, HK97 gp10 family [Tissierella praeacuta]
MSYKIKSTESEEIEVFLNEIMGVTEEIEERFLKRAAEVVKGNIVRNLNVLRTKTNDPEHKHMADDVNYRIVKDEYGEKVARIRGGKKTGTKWHLVNDGTYRSKATHFIDTALKQSDEEIEQIFEEEMERGGF